MEINEIGNIILLILLGIFTVGGYIVKDYSSKVDREELEDLDY